MREPRYTGRKTDFYVGSAQVAAVVNLAVDLHRPILVEGEPGCGKTMLAHAIAAEKKLGPAVKIMVKSTSRAQDLLYRLDSLRRLQDVQTPGSRKAQYVYPYLSLGPLGSVVHDKRRVVVLIDEIDKADLDFPNDLLDVLDTFTFQIDDLPPEEEARCRRERGFGRTVTGDAARPPIVVITSNREKRLPEPFLRRCLYVRVKFPETAAELCEIVRKNTKLTAAQLDQGLLAAAVDAFRSVRGLAAGVAQKPPTTSELIDWVQILHWNGETVESLRENPCRPAHWETLFKTMPDLDAYDALSRTKSGLPAESK